jgi:hypothetical protein
MFFTPRVVVDGKSNPTSLCGHEQGDLPVDDPPPAEYPSESYASWRPSAIFNLGPFTAPPAG